MKRKEYNEITNKIVGVDQVIGRGQRTPVLELIFKTDGHNRIGGHKVYIDYKCAKELLSKLEINTKEIESKYYCHEFYERIQRSAREILL